MDLSVPHCISLDCYPFDFSAYGDRCYVPVVNGNMRTDKKVDCRFIFDKIRTSSSKSWGNISGLTKDPKPLSTAPAVLTETLTQQQTLTTAPAVLIVHSKRRRRKPQSTRPKNQPFIVQLENVEIIQFITARIPFIYVSSEHYIDTAIHQMQDMFAMLDHEKQTIGIDFEGHNNHGIKYPKPWNKPHAMLVQISIYNHTWLWDLYALHSTTDTNHIMKRIYNEVLRYGLLIFAGAANDLECLRQCGINLRPHSYIDILPANRNCLGQIDKYLGDGGWREDLERIKLLKKKRGWLADWKKRPLSQSMIAYAVFDSYILPRAFASILRTHCELRKNPFSKKALESVYNRKRCHQQ